MAVDAGVKVFAVAVFRRKKDVAQGVDADDPAVRELMFESYDAFADEEKIFEAVNVFKTRFYKNMYKKYSAAKIPLEEKALILKKIDKILKEINKK